MKRSKANAGDGWHTIEVRTSPRVRMLLQALTNQGLHGRTIEETAEVILFEQLRKMLIDENSILYRGGK